MPTYSSTFDGSEDPLSEGGVWTSVSLAETVFKFNGLLSAHTVNFEAWARYTVPFADDQSSEITITTLGVAAGVNVITRLSGTTGYNAYWVSDGFYLFRMNGGGSSTTLAGPVAASVFTSGRRLRLDSTGSLHRVYDDDVLKISVTDATYTSGQPGLGLYDALSIGTTSITAWTGISTPPVSFDQGLYTLRGSRSY